MTRENSACEVLVFLRYCVSCSMPYLLHMMQQRASAKLHIVHLQIFARRGILAL